MKMISSTSITSTIGVTLMSELTFAPSFRFANAMEFSLLLTRAVAKAGSDEDEEEWAPVVKPAPLQQLMFCSPLFYNAGSGGPRSRDDGPKPWP
jgi:hypothetical protein